MVSCTHESHPWILALGLVITSCDRVDRPSKSRESENSTDQRSELPLSKSEDTAKHWAVYIGSGTWASSIIAFNNFLEWKGHTWREIDENVINKGNLVGSYDGLFMPGGWAGNYNESINDSGDQHVRDFVFQGGAYIGIRARATGCPLLRGAIFRSSSRSRD